MSLLRVFIAIEIPDEIQAAIQERTAGLRAAVGDGVVRWVARENVHLTLKFLGEVSAANVELLAQMLRAQAAQHEAFSLEVGGLGIFPGPRRPRVLWIGIQAPPALDSLQRAIEAAAARLGYPPEERPFSPHLTIGRVSQHASPADLTRLRQAVETTQVGALGRVRADAAILFRSDLRPGGPVYTPLVHAPLRSDSPR